MATDGDRRAALEARIQQFHGVSFEQVLNEIQYLRDAGDSVIAGGSLAYGLGNHLSDLDLVVGGPTTVDSTGIPLEHFMGSQGSLRVDVWKLAQGLIEGTFKRAQEALESDVPIVGSFGDVDHEDEFKLMHRMVFGVVVDGDGLEFPPDMDCRAVATRLVVREYAERMRTSALQAQLALRAGRPLAAVVTARLAVEEALNAAVIDRGLPFTGDKWLRERLENDAEELAVGYEPFRQLPEDPSAGAAAFVERALAACSDLWGIDVEVDALMGGAYWQNSDLQLFTVGDDRFLVSAEVGALWSLTEDEANAWNVLVADQDEQATARWGIANCDVEASTLCLRLHEEGALRLRWTAGVHVDELKTTKAARA
jgi:hypothetical protein